MTEFLIIAHSPLASALKAAAAHAFPDAAARVRVLDVEPQEPPDQIERRARDLIAAADPVGSAPCETLILTDVFGATPCNVAQRLADGSRIKIVTGVNVPMLWRALNYADESLDRVLARAMAGATQGILAVAAARPPNQTQHLGTRPGDGPGARQDQ